MRFLCAVRCCRYIADSDIEGFLVCVLHDAPQTRAILEELKLPAAFWMHGRPIVLPCGDLLESDFEQQAAPEDAIQIWDDPAEHVQSIPSTPSRTIAPCYDLTNTDFVGHRNASD